MKTASEIQRKAFDDFSNWENWKYPDGHDLDIVDLAEEYGKDCFSGEWPQ